MMRGSQFRSLTDRLRRVGLRPTRQRLSLAALMFDGVDPHRHMSAEALHAEARAAAVKVSLATVYNTLHQFTQAGLLREVVVEPGRSYFDTNIGDHHHFYLEGSGQLIDIPGDAIALTAAPPAPVGTRVSRVDIVIRLTEGA